MDVADQYLPEPEQHRQAITHQIDIRELRFIPEQIMRVDCIPLGCESPNQTKADPVVFAHREPVDQPTNLKLFRMSGCIQSEMPSYEFHECCPQPLYKWGLDS